MTFQTVIADRHEAEAYRKKLTAAGVLFTYERAEVTTFTYEAEAEIEP